jgi:hypothetical protein
VWQAEEDLASSVDPDIAPEIAVLAPSQDLLLVYVRTPDQQILYRRWNGATWQLPAPVQNAFTHDRPALAALPGVGAVLAYRGADGKAYTSRYDGASWSSPAGIANPNVRVDAPPVVARGLGDAEVELVYVTLQGAQNTAYHTRFIGGEWSAPVAIFTVDNGIKRIAIASPP